MENQRKQEELAEEERKRLEELRRAGQTNVDVDRGKEADKPKMEQKEENKPTWQEHKKLDQVDIDYRYAMDNLKDYLDRVDNSHRIDQTGSEHAVGKESPAMERYKAHEKEMSGKVQDYIKEHNQSQSKEQEQSQSHDR